MALLTYHIWVMHMPCILAIKTHTYTHYTYIFMCRSWVHIYLLANEAFKEQQILCLPSLVSESDGIQSQSQSSNQVDQQMKFTFMKKYSNLVLFYASIKE